MNWWIAGAILAVLLITVVTYLVLCMLRTAGERRSKWPR